MIVHRFKICRYVYTGRVTIMQFCAFCVTYKKVSIRYSPMGLINAAVSATLAGSGAARLACLPKTTRTSIYLPCDCARSASAAPAGCQGAAAAPPRGAAAVCATILTANLSLWQTDLKCLPHEVLTGPKCTCFCRNAHNITECFLSLFSTSSYLLH